MKILFVHQGLQSFVQKDLDILRSAHDVRPLQFTGRRGLPRNLLPDLWQLCQGVLWCDLTFSWFGKLHAFFAVLFSKILGKKSVVVAGGDDVANCIIAGRPYGLCADPVGKWFAYFIFRQADLVVAISEYNWHETITNTSADPGKVVLVPHGFDGDVFHRLSGIHRENAVVTIGTVDQESYDRKGLRLFVEAARLLPDSSFLLIGPHIDGAVRKLRSLAPGNVTLTGGLYGDSLLKLLSRCSVYVKASEWESFGCSLAEAMLCECVPVVSRRTALPEVVGDCGFYVDKLEPKELAEKIKLGLQNPQVGKMARERIIKNFPLGRRKEELLKAVSLLGDQG
ncbi:MAG: glycosyltransferase [candidate division Zixibacteria bacterium]|nr:glycosyltransferase [candidate division Zixibacteria bacterium]